MKKFSLLLILFSALGIFVQPSCRKKGEEAEHTVRYEVMSDTNFARDLSVQLTKNKHPNGDEIIAYSVFHDITVPFTVTHKVRGLVTDETYNYALTAEVYPKYKVTLAVYIDGRLRKQITTKREDFLSETMLPF